ncbi:nuclear transport factor 2 family protein [Streptomyces sp. NPDC091259]|uniref:nuclear transport factor 2 family protein n=1 Tax=Streptomyces sp. NPDC091259 TaxID=3365976 RepID=UPI00380AA183
MTFPTTAEVIHCFNRAFIEHDASSLADLIADDCVMEAREPAPDGARYEGRAECLQFCRARRGPHDPVRAGGRRHHR